MSIIRMSSSIFGNDNLDELKDFVVSKLDDSLKKIHPSPKTLKPIVDRAIYQSFIDIKKRKNHPKYKLIADFWIDAIHSLALMQIKSVLSQHDKIDDLKDRIKSFRSLFVIGAGISFEVGLPFTHHLDEILKFVRSADFNELRLDNQKCQQFKRQFKQISDGLNPGVSHRTLAKNLGDKIVDIICLNWDDLIERAFTSEPIPSVNEDNEETQGGKIWKFHGDVRKINIDNLPGSGGWVFPDEGGYVFKSFSKYLESEDGLKNKMFMIVIAGYSENDNRINAVINTLEDNGKRSIFRIGLDLARIKQTDYIVGPSDYVLPKILDF